MLAVNAQQLNSADIYLQLKKLKVIASVLYVAAHPDDENNSFLPYLAKEKMYRTGYLSLTRGDGGQNLIGSEQGIELGLIRTQELLTARKIDGSEQYFSTAYEFGFSKNAREAFTIWNKEQVLSDVVWMIRKFQPDIIITRFPGDARAGHGHHAASSLIANEAFIAAADATKFPEQLKRGVSTWQAKRILWNTFSFGNVNTTNNNQLKIEVGNFNPLLGESYGEIGGEARTMHKSQGEGRPKRKGSITEYFTTTGGDTAKNDLMEGIVTNWNRLKDGAVIDAAIDNIIKNYNFEHPENSVHALVSLYKKMQGLSEHTNWWDKKLTEVQEAIFNCSGVFAEATTKDEFVLEGDTAAVSCFINKRANVTIELEGIKIDRVAVAASQTIATNQNYTFDTKVLINEPAIANATQPYWLQAPQTLGNFTVQNPLLIGNAWNDALLSATFSLRIDSVSFYVTKPVQYKYVDPVKGEVYQPFVIMPHISMSLTPHVSLLNMQPKKKNSNTDSVYILYKSNFTQKNVATTLYVLQDTIKTVFENQLRDFEKNKSYTIALPINKYYNPSKGNAIQAAMRFKLNGKDIVCSNYFASIEYDHIPNIHYSFRDKIKFVNEEVKTVGNKIGYINGAGDKVPEAIKQMGYDFKMINEADVTDENLKQFDAIIVGIRAYNIYEWLTNKNEVLNNYIKNGGNLIVQYLKSNTVGLKKVSVGPYPFVVNAGTRVTEEEAVVNFLLPNHPVLNYPNKITDKDFENWVQERSTYQAEQIDAHFEMPIGMHDTGEKESNGSLLVASYGKGNIAYVSLVLFRQLPAGIPGSFRLLANLIGMEKH